MANGVLNQVTQTATIVSWDRANKVRIDNTYNANPQIVFEVQTVTTTNGIVTGTIPKSIVVVNYDPTVSYPLLNPNDGSVLDPNGGSHTMLEIQLYSLFMSLPNPTPSKN